MVRLLLGIVKGGVIGGGIGYLSSRMGVTSGTPAVAVYGVIGAVVGLFCGRPVWRQETIWTSILKAVFGFALALGLGFAGRRWLGGVHIPVSFIPGSADHPFPEVPALFGAAVGTLYGVLVELDDAGGSAGGTPANKSAERPRPAR